MKASIIDGGRLTGTGIDSAGNNGGFVMDKGPSDAILSGCEELFWPLERRGEELERNQWLSDLGWPEIMALASYMSPYKIPTGTAVCREGDREVFLCLICDGVIDVVKEDSSGCAKVLTSISRGKTIGEMSLIDGEPRSATMIARSDATLLVLKLAGFRDLAEVHPRLYGKLAEKIARVLSQRLRQTSGALAEYI
ncbi:Crp/Fnr family transcriptional regulator [Geotalea toluenoxydans]|uniref:Crp/Fnr family transcriptional regulator n=1 Tax=Geotalea toluenoxydans TaxID=421624 RepID=UPI0006D2C2D6|nr:cyclic nucleotide-binding domain-containing protein [Geotalea toluenoxydans]